MVKCDTSGDLGVEDWCLQSPHPSHLRLQTHLELPLMVVKSSDLVTGLETADK